MRKSCLLAAVCASLFISQSSIAAQNLVGNGSFEDGFGASGYGGFATLGVGAANVTAWTIAGGNIDWINGYWQASDGNKSIDMNGDTAATLTQSISTVAGQVYLLTFDLAANPGGPTTKTMQVSAGNTSNTFSFNSTGTSPNNMGWSLQTMQFTATGSSTLLSFHSTTNGACCWGPALDNVSVVAVPEPETYGMFLAGLGLMGAIARRRKLAA